jgi:hypothetical protein
MRVKRDNCCSEQIDRHTWVAGVIVTARVLGAAWGRFLASTEGGSLAGTPTTKVTSNLG